MFVEIALLFELSIFRNTSLIDLYTDLYIAIQKFAKKGIRLSLADFLHVDARRKFL